MTFQVRDSLAESQVADLVRLYQSEWWTRGRKESEAPEEPVRLSISQAGS